MVAVSLKRQLVPLSGLVLPLMCDVVEEKQLP